MSETQQIPAFPSLTDADFTRAANADPVIADGDMRMLITGAAIFVGKKPTNLGQVYYHLDLVPLAKPGDGNSAMRHLRDSYLITSPWPTAGQKTPPPGRAAGDLVAFMHALFPDEGPRYPYRDGDLAKGVYKYKTGTVDGKVNFQLTVVFTSEFLKNPSL